jgi:hypothetical protein
MHMHVDPYVGVCVCVWGCVCKCVYPTKSVKVNISVASVLLFDFGLRHLKQVHYKVRK